MQILQTDTPTWQKNVQALLFCEERYLYVDFPETYRALVQLHFTIFIIRKE